MKRINKAVVITFASTFLSAAGLALSSGVAFADVNVEIPPPAPAPIQNNVQTNNTTSKAEAFNFPGSSSLTAQSAAATASSVSIQNNTQTLSTDATTFNTTLQNNVPQLTNNSYALAENRANNTPVSTGAQVATANSFSYAQQTNNQNATYINTAIKGTPQVTSQSIVNGANTIAQNDAQNGVFGLQNAAATTGLDSRQANAQTLTAGFHYVTDAQGVKSMVQDGQVQLAGTIQNNDQSIRNVPDMSKAQNFGDNGYFGAQNAQATVLVGLQQSNNQNFDIHHSAWINQNLHGEDVHYDAMGVAQNNTQAFSPSNSAYATNSGEHADISGVQQSIANAGTLGVDSHGKLIMVPSQENNIQTFSYSEGAALLPDFSSLHLMMA